MPCANLLQSWEKMVGTFYLIQEKINPRFPNSMLIRVTLSEASARSPTLTDGSGKDYDKSKNLCFLLEQCHVSFSILW